MRADLRYTVTLERQPQRALDSLRGDIYRRIIEALRGLADNPRPHGIKKLQGRAAHYRIRVAD